MFCKHCGSEIDDKAVVCVHCGVPVEEEVITTDENKPAVKKRVNVFGIIGFVIGILSIYLSMYFCIASIVGLIFSIVGICLWKRSTHNGLAIAGLVINILTLVAWGILWLFIYSLITALSNITCQPPQP